MLRQRCKDRLLAGASRALYEEMLRRHAKRGQGRWRWFTAPEALVAEALANIIVPPDEEGPGMEDIEVLGPPAVVVLDKIIAACPERQSVYARGLLAFDLWAIQEHGKEFAELPRAEQTLLFAAAERVYEKWKAAGGPIGRVLRVAQILVPGQSIPLLAGLLYPHVRGDCFQAFYTSRVSWIWLEYDGPPMEKGYPKLDVSRGLE